MSRPVAVLAFALVTSVPGAALADLASREQSACFDKAANDACALPDGAPGRCVSRVPPGKTTPRLTCDPAPAAVPLASASAPPAAGSAAVAPSASAAPTPAPAPAPAPSATPAAAPAPSAAPAPEPDGCAWAGGSTAGGLATIALGLAVAALATRRRPRG